MSILIKSDREDTAPLRQDSLLSLDHVCLEVGGKAIIENVSLDVGAGEIVTLIGPNGSGKTTLARIALGLMPADSGNVGLAPRIKIGYVPQTISVDELLPLTVQRFLTLGGVADGERCRAALAEVGATNLLGVPVQSVSGGELRRILLARALLREPDLLVLDEPAQGVDVTGQAELYQLIGRIREQRGCGVLLISHDLHLVMAATDRVICLNHHVCCSGSPESVSQDPAYIDLFGPKEAEQIAVYAHSHDHHHDIAGDVVGEHKQSGKDVSDG